MPYRSFSIGGDWLWPSLGTAFFRNVEDFMELGFMDMTCYDVMKRCRRKQIETDVWMTCNDSNT